MKNYIILTVLSIIFIYLMIAFIKLDINFINWSEDCRFLCVILSGIISFIIMSHYFIVEKNLSL